MIAINAMQLSKAYGHYHVLQEVNLEIASGECYALFGPNGSGKTTLLRILATLYRPTGGRFEILGYDGTNEKQAIRSDLMFLTHGAHLYDDLNALENVRFSLALRGLTPSDHEIKFAFDKVGIGAFTDMKTRHYSAGMKKRLTLAKIMLADPKILLLDEPFSSLDETGTEILQRFILDTVHKGGTVLLSTHNREKAAGITHRAGHLRQGVLHPITL